jgi:diguanylate cyclase (GGDEF)-like protein
MLVTLLTGIANLTFPDLYISLIIYGIFPANVILTLGYQERGIFTYTGLWRLTLILLQSAGLYALWHFDPALVQTLITTDIPNIPEPVQDLLVYSPFNPLISIILGLNGAALLVAVYWQRSSTTRAIFTATIAVLAGPLLQMDNASDALIMASAMLMAVTILRDSHQMAYLDELTGLPQRRALNENLLILGQKFSIAMLDIDHFKKFNDKYGHDVGDQVLQMVSRKLRKVRGSGKVYRYGGEEFIVTLSDCNQEMSLAVAQRLRELVEHNPLKTDDKVIRLTISVGVVSTEFANAQSVVELFEMADKCLYRAKASGRNQCVLMTQDILDSLNFQSTEAIEQP